MAQSQANAKKIRQALEQVEALSLSSLLNEKNEQGQREVREVDFFKSKLQELRGNL